MGVLEGGDAVVNQLYLLNEGSILLIDGMLDSRDDLVGDIGNRDWSVGDGLDL